MKHVKHKSTIFPTVRIRCLQVTAELLKVQGAAAGRDAVRLTAELLLLPVQLEGR